MYERVLTATKTTTTTTITSTTSKKKKSGTMSTDDGEMANANDTEERVRTETVEKMDDIGSSKLTNVVGIDDRVWSLRIKVDKVISKFEPMKEYIEQNGRRFLERPLGEH